MKSLDEKNEIEEILKLCCFHRRLENKIRHYFISNMINSISLFEFIDLFIPQNLKSDDFIYSKAPIFKLEQFGIYLYFDSLIAITELNIFEEFTNEWSRRLFLFRIIDPEFFHTFENRILQRKKTSLLTFMNNKIIYTEWLRLGYQMGWLTLGHTAIEKTEVEKTTQS